MRTAYRLTGGLALVLFLGCDAPELVGTGSPCNSLSDCELGLTCVEGRCSDDLTGLMGQVPGFEPDAALPMDGGLDGAAQEAGLEDGALPPVESGVPDASTPRPDASTPDASLPDASAPDASVPDASLPDASLPDASLPDASLPDAMPEDAEVEDAQ